ncbi:hypothetical protein K474DRAFT_465719 [Panus rudis PR-1116 ss-1]|nr:hypothetical protein K474DRAFT_465719 [Panus rudis PR-1116 ss-1]
MLILTTSSNCDICLEVYNSERTPHVIRCGHTLCLSCLKALTRLSCPFCRHPFDSSEIIPLHIDKTSSRSSTPTDSDESESEDEDEDAEHVSEDRELHNRITQIVNRGATYAQLFALCEEGRAWLDSQDEDKFTDLRTAHLLLCKYVNMKAKQEEKKKQVTALTEERDKLAMQLDKEREIANARYHSLEDRRQAELEQAAEMEKKLSDRIRKTEDTWRTRVSCHRLP